MPAMRPADISDRIRLSNKARAEVRRLVTEDGAADTLLSGVIVELAPREHGVASLGAQHELLSGADEQAAGSAIGIPSS
jgi:hypothetical protein